MRTRLLMVERAKICRLMYIFGGKSEKEKRHLLFFAHKRAGESFIPFAGGL
jgi:hypothetical protein